MNRTPKTGWLYNEALLEIARVTDFHTNNIEIKMVKDIRTQTSAHDKFRNKATKYRLTCNWNKEGKQNKVLIDMYIHKLINFISYSLLFLH